MQIIVILLLAVALALLVLGLIGASPALVVGSIVASLAAVAVIVRARRRRMAQAAATAAAAASAARLEAERDEQTRVLAAAAAAAGRHAATVPADSPPAADAIADQPAADHIEDPPAAGTIAPLAGHGDDLVWVIDGRPRYHLAGCGFLLSRSGEQISLSQAVEDGFTPCSLCDPDNQIVPAS